MSGAIRRLFEWVARSCLRHRWWVMVAAAVIAVASALWSVPVRTDPQIIHLLPADEPTVAATMALMDADPGATPLLIALEPVPTGAQRDAVVAWCDDLADSVEVEQVLCDLPGELTLQLAALQLSADRVADLDRRLGALRRLGPAASNPMLAARVLGPLDDLAPPPPEVGLRGGRVVLWPTGRVNGVDAAGRLMTHVRATLDRADLPSHGVRVVWIGGTARHVAEDGPTMARDLSWTAGLALVLCGGLLLLGLGSWRGTVLVLVPLLWANLVTLGLLHVIFGSLNLYTVTALPILLGLGIDFGIHGVGRMAELRHQLDPGPALERAWGATGPPAMVAAGTSVIGFVALSSSSFLGFRQLGVALSMGLFLSFVAVYLLVPALSPWLDPGPGRRPWLRPGVARSWAPTRWVAGLALGSSLLVAALIGAVGAPRVQVTTDTSTLRQRGLSYDDLGDVREHLALGFAPAVIVVPSDQLSKVHQRLLRAQQAGELSQVRRVISLESVLPADAAGRTRDLRALGLRARSLPPGTLPPALREATDALARLPEGGLQREDLPPGLLRAVGAHGADQALIIAQMEGNQWDLVVASKMIDQLLAQGVDPIGVPATQRVLYRIVRADLPWIIGLALGGVVMAIVVGAGDVRRALISLLALLAGAGAVVGVVGLVGVPLSLVSAPAVPILLGIGVDGAVHLGHRLAEEGRGGAWRAVRSAGGLSALSALTTTVGFGALSAASSRGIQSFGHLVALGMVALVLTTLPSVILAGWLLLPGEPGNQE